MSGLHERKATRDQRVNRALQHIEAACQFLAPDTKTQNAFWNMEARMNLDHHMQEAIIIALVQALEDGLVKGNWPT